MSQAATTPLGVAELADEERHIVLWRVEQFGRLDYVEDDAWELALSSADLGLARRLAGAGCPATVALRILL